MRPRKIGKKTGDRPRLILLFYPITFSRKKTKTKNVVCPLFVRYLFEKRGLSPICLPYLFENDINNSVNAGLEVLVSRDPISVANFTGAGYIITDPITGSGSYRISGGRDGDNSPAPQSVYPLPQMPATPIHGIMLGSTFRAASVGLATESGIVTGIAMPAEVASRGAVGGGGGAAGPIVAALVVALIFASTSAKNIEERYPRTSRIFRHYTTSVSKPLILLSNVLRSSDETADFGPGVYTVEPPDGDIPARYLQLKQK